jgi:hypothetical protein
MNDKRTGIQDRTRIQREIGAVCSTSIQMEVPAYSWDSTDRFGSSIELHRGEVRARWLKWLGKMSCVLGCMSIYPCPILPVFFSIPLGLMVWLFARRDLASMRAGFMNRRWMGLTVYAEARALDGLVFSAMASCFWGLLYAFWCIREHF